MKRPGTARAVKPNIGIRIWYRKQIEKRIDKLRACILKRVPAAYRKGRDTDLLNKAIEELRRHWTGVFTEAGNKIAERLIKRIDATSRNAIKRTFRA